MACCRLLAAGGLLGWAAHATASAHGASRHPDGRPTLVAGSFQQDLNDPYGQELVLTLTNTADRRVDVSHVRPQGWHATSSPVQLQPGEAVDLPVDVSVDCRSTPPPSDVATARITTDGTSQVVGLPMLTPPTTRPPSDATRCTTGR